MLHTSLVAVLFSLELVSQTPGKAPGRTANWVVIQSKEDGYSFAMPARPTESGKANATPFGQAVFKTYRCSVRDEEFIMQHTTLPRPIPLNKVVTLLHSAESASISRLPRVVEEKEISLKDVAGLELLCEGAVGNLSGNRTVKVHLFVKGNSQFVMIALSSQEHPLPAETNPFLNSLRLDGGRAVIPTVAAKPRPASSAKRKPLGKVDLVDKTPEDALRTFMIAATMADEQTLRSVTIPNPDLDLLLMVEPPAAEVIKEMKQRMATARIQRLKAGDPVTLPGNAAHVIREDEVGQDRAVLLPADSPYPFRIQRVAGHWKVDAGPIIAARKAVEAAHQKAVTK